MDDINNNNHNIVIDNKDGVELEHWSASVKKINKCDISDSNLMPQVKGGLVYALIIKKEKNNGRKKRSN